MTVRRANPEHKIQSAVKQYLTYCLPMPSSPDAVEWTASLAGAHLSPSQRAKAKASGLRPGFPDLMFILPGGRVKFIEMKAEKGVLSDDQKRIRDRLSDDDFALCRSVEEVATALRKWGVRLREHPFNDDYPDMSAGLGSP